MPTIEMKKYALSQGRELEMGVGPMLGPPVMVPITWPVDVGTIDRITDVTRAVLGGDHPDASTVLTLEDGESVGLIMRLDDAAPGGFGYLVEIRTRPWEMAQT